MQTAPAVALPSLPAGTLEQEFLSTARRRFKAEVNRLTGGALRERLAGNAEAEDLAFILSYVYAFAWLRLNVPACHRAEVTAPFRQGVRARLMDLLADADDATCFVRGYVDHLMGLSDDTLRERRQLLRLLRRCGDDPTRLTEHLLSIWTGLGLLGKPHAESYRELARAERERYAGMLGPEDRARLALVDALPDRPGPPAPFAKLGIIPAMGCPQTCRHCMFIWRPPLRSAPDPAPLYHLVAAHTQNVLFTGGDLTRHLHHFVRAIGEMRPVETFAILLNGDFADDPAATEAVLQDMATAIRARPRAWPPARVLLQISFDEFHQEIVTGRDGELRERIPVAKIANIVEAVPRHPEIQLCLVHKQTALNFSMALFREGVFGRLVAELGRRGQQVQVVAASPSPRLKQHPLEPGRRGQLVKDASFVLARHPERPILLTSSTVDAHGRAALLDPGETVNERALLQQMLEGAAGPGEAFDTDLMFWLNGWVTLFAAVHVCLGNLYEDGADRVLARHRKDPLTAALRVFDRRLLAFYGEIRGDLGRLLDRASGPHHLFHCLTEDPAVRLHLTRRLAGA